MTEDLVDRLEHRAKQNRDRRYSMLPCWQLMLEAAAEIRRLRDENHQKQRTEQVL